MRETQSPTPDGGRGHESRKKELLTTEPSLGENAALLTCDFTIPN